MEWLPVINVVVMIFVVLSAFLVRLKSKILDAKIEDVETIAEVANVAAKSALSSFDGAREYLNNSRDLIDNAIKSLSVATSGEIARHIAEYHGRSKPEGYEDPNPEHPANQD